MLLAKLDTFGDVAAEDDAVLDYFVATNAVERISKKQVFLVLGRKGTGKTAIVRFFTESESKTSKALNLRGYPWNVHASRIDHGASDIEAYVSSWRYLIAVEFAVLALKQPSAWRSSAAENLEKFLKENYGGLEPALADILRPPRLKLTKLSLSPSIMGNQLGGIDLDRSRGDTSFGFELNALTQSIMESVDTVLKDIGSQPISLHFDELDQGITTLDESRSKMLVGLILATREINRETSKSKSPVHPVIYLRSDIWEDLNFSDKNKISETLTLRLEWNSSSLNELVQTRLKAKLGKDVTWDLIAEPELMRGSQTKWNHVLARTFLRPRDVIRFLNGALKEGKKRDAELSKLTNVDVINAREEYSSYLKKELDDEIGPHWAEWSEALQACSGISTITFDRSEFEKEYSQRKSKKNQVNFEEALGYLYRFSVIGYQTRSGYGGSGWVFQYSDPTAGWDNSAKKFKVHSGLKEYAKLRESRAL